MLLRFQEGKKKNVRPALPLVAPGVKVIVNPTRAKLRTLLPGARLSLCARWYSASNRLPNNTLFNLRTCRSQLRKKEKYEFECWFVEFVELTCISSKATSILRD